MEGGKEGKSDDALLETYDCVRNANPPPPPAAMGGMATALISH